MQFAFYIIPTARSNQLSIYKHRENLQCASEQRERAWKCLHLYVPKLLFLSMFELVLTNFVCMFVNYFVTYVHSVQFPCLLMTWHYKRLTNCRQDAHIKIIHVSERAERARNFFFAFLHSKPAISFIIFVGTSDILSVWYNIQSWNIFFFFFWGGGDDNTGHPHLKYRGDISPPPPPPPRDRHPWHLGWNY